MIPSNSLGIPETFPDYFIFVFTRVHQDFLGFFSGFFWILPNQILPDSLTLFRIFPDSLEFSPVLLSLFIFSPIHPNSNSPVFFRILSYCSACFRIFFHSLRVIRIYSNLPGFSTVFSKFFLILSNRILSDCLGVSRVISDFSDFFRILLNWFIFSRIHSNSL